MTKLYRLLYIVLLILTEQVFGIKQLNLAIIYDETEGVINLSSDRVAISITMMDLFKSQITPILLPGNLALRLGALFFESINDPSDPFKTNFDKFAKDFDAIKMLPENQLAQDKKRTFCEQLVKEKNKLISSYRAHDDEWDNANYFANGIKPLYQVANIKKLEKLYDEANCRTFIDITQKEFENVVDVYKKGYFSNLNLNDWHMYLVKDTPQHLVLFIPNNYARVHGAIINDELQLEMLGFASNALEKVATKDLAARATYYSFAPEKIAHSITRVFALPKHDATAPRWNILLFGHGWAPEAGKTPITLTLKRIAVTQPSPLKTPAMGPSLKDVEGLIDKDRRDTYARTSARITGMPAHEFLKLMDFWPSLPTNVVVYLTCFGGGTNAEAIAQLFNLNVMLAQRTAPGKLFPIVISTAGSEQSTFIDAGAAYKDFFDQLAKTFEPPAKSKSDTESLLRVAVKLVSRDTPVILFPHVKMIPQPAAFSSLIEPDYELNMDDNGILRVDGQQATPPAVIIGENGEITFNWEGATERRLVLKTSTINKKLIFNCPVAPNFDIKILSDHIVFDSIKFSSLPLSEFLAKSFREHGKIAHISIKSLSGHNSMLPHAKDIADDTVPLSDVELIVLANAIPNNIYGYVMFTHDSKWYIFTLWTSFSKEDLELKSLLTIEIPPNKDERIAMQSNILKQLSSNGELAQFYKFSDATRLAALLGDVPSYPPLANQSLRQQAFSRMVENGGRLPPFTPLEVLLELDPASLFQRINVLDQSKKDKAFIDLLSNPSIIKDKKKSLIGSFLLAGAKPIETITINDLIEGLQFAYDLHRSSEELDRAVATLSQSQKEAILRAILSKSYISGRTATALIIALGHLPEGMVINNDLARWITEHDDKTLGKMANCLTKEQRIQILEIAKKQELYPKSSAFEKILMKA